MKTLDVLKESFNITICTSLMSAMESSRLQRAIYRCLQKASTTLRSFLYERLQPLHLR